jgi:hypothetical protein
VVAALAQRDWSRPGLRRPHARDYRARRGLRHTYDDCLGLLPAGSEVPVRAALKRTFSSRLIRSGQPRRPIREMPSPIQLMSVGPGFVSKYKIMATMMLLLA